MTNKRFWCLDEYKGETSPIVDEKFAPTNEWLCNKLNELHEENIILKKVIEEDNDLIKSLLSTYCNKKWEKFCKSYGVDFK